ncbi:MAG: hypothetical protein V1892_00930 [bacterium]
MLTNEDIQKLIEVFATRDEIATKKDLEELRTELKQDFSDLQSAVDNYAKKADAYFQEMVMLAHKVDRLEKWVLQIAEKIGFQLKS